MSYALEAGSARLLLSLRCLPRDSAHPKGLGDELGRHFLKREGTLIDYPCACIIMSRINFFTEVLLSFSQYQS